MEYFLFHVKGWTQGHEYAEVVNVDFIEAVVLRSRRSRSAHPMTQPDHILNTIPSLACLKYMAGVERSAYGNGTPAFLSLLTHIERHVDAPISCTLAAACQFAEPFPIIHRYADSHLNVYT